MSNKKGQAYVEYILVMVAVVLVAAWGLGMLKCYLHQIWVKMACDIIYPYPAHEAQGELQDYCEYIDPGECGAI
ncbi:MAG: hypothetical protein JXA66_07725 [Oligoflexia bacterium]|nr:hypothetical protein [Oligoflexia bacterium]